MGIVDFQIVRQAGVKILGRIVIAALEKTPRQDAKPQLHLIQPRAMLGGKVKDMLMGRIAEERAPLDATLQLLRDKGDRTPWGHELADLETPGGIEIIHDPIVALHRGQWVDTVGQRGSPIRTGAGLAQIPHELACRHHEGGQEGPHPMPDVLVLAFFWLARRDGLGRLATLENRPPCCFISADDEASCLVEAQRLAIELTEVLRLGLQVGIVAVEPVHAPRRLAIRLLQDAPDARATDGLQPMLRERCDQVVQTPPGGGAMIRGRFLGRHRQYLDALRGGKRAAGDPSVVHPASRCSRAPESDFATGRPYGAHRPARWPRADWMVGLARRSGGSTDSERPRLGGWHGPAQGMRNGRVPQESGDTGRAIGTGMVKVLRVQKT